MHVGARHQEPPGRASEAPQQERRQRRHDRAERTADGGQAEPKVRESEWLSGTSGAGEAVPGKLGNAPEMTKFRTALEFLARSAKQPIGAVFPPIGGARRASTRLCPASKVAYLRE